jgi:hypothetical protein
MAQSPTIHRPCVHCICLTLFMIKPVHVIKHNAKKMCRVVAWQTVRPLWSGTDRKIQTLSGIDFRSSTYYPVPYTVSHSVSCFCDICLTLGFVTPWGIKLITVLYKNSIHVPHGHIALPLNRPIWLMLHTETMTVYCDNLMKQINIPVLFTKEPMHTPYIHTHIQKYKVK